ncbi:hypothetical protein [Streptomyces griseoluteus]|uniref:hypothetical protein n=1 Tax=Streptomyces griseoluteus TaxID=29306 RepID=UPI0036FE1623
MNSISGQGSSVENGITRRSVVRGAAVLGAATVIGLSGTTAASAAGKVKGADRKTTAKPRKTTANGWPVQDNTDRDSQVWTRAVAGTGLSVPVWIGDPEAILLHVVRRFHYEVETLHSPDLAGWQQDNGLDMAKSESNLASGTAVRIRPGAAAKGSLFPLQELVIRDVLADCQGVVRWGGDDKQADESLFYLDCGPDDTLIHTVATKLRAEEATPGLGAGSAVNVWAPARRSRADHLAKQQRMR